MTPNPREQQLKLDALAGFVLHYGLALIFIWFGSLKFTAFEAEGIAPFGMNSPLMSWAFDSLGQQGFSNAIGVIELAIGVLIAARPISAKLSAIGGFGAVVTFLITLSFLFSTPGAIQQGYAFPALSGMVGQFLIKDLVLLGASLTVAAEALRAMRSERMDIRRADAAAGELPR